MVVVFLQINKSNKAKKQQINWLLFLFIDTIKKINFVNFKGIKLMKKLLLASLLSALISVANAEVKPYIEGSVGWLDSNSTSSSTYKTKFDSDVNYGAEIGLKDIAGSGIRLGGSITHVNRDYKAYNNSGAQIDTGKDRSNIYLLNAYYDIKTGTALSPFIGVGLGMIDSNNAKDNEFAYALHGGAKYNINNNVYVGAKGSFYRTNGIKDKEDSLQYSDSNSYSINALLGYEF